MSVIRVLQLITELEQAGAERCVFELATRLDKQRFAVEVAALRGGPYEQLLREAGVPVTVLGVRGKWDVLKLRKLAGLLRRGRFDIVHTHLFHADLAGKTAAAFAPAVPMVNTVHVAEVRWRPWHFWLPRFTSGGQRVIVCVSEAVRELHAARTHLPADKYRVIYNGVDAAAYARDEATRRRVRAEWQVADDQPVLLFAGRLDPQKGIETLLAAMTELLAGSAGGGGGDSGGPLLVIAGQGPQRELVERFAASTQAHGRVRVLGFVQDMPALLSAADIFVMPSRWEGFGLAAAEAMAAGLPVVATSVPGLTELIADGQTGLLVGPDDPHAFASAVRKLIDQPHTRAAMGVAGMERMRERFNIERNIAQHAALYEELVSQRPAAEPAWQ